MCLQGFVVVLVEVRVVVGGASGFVVVFCLWLGGFRWLPAEANNNDGGDVVHSFGNDEEC